MLDQNVSQETANSHLKPYLTGAPHASCKDTCIIRPSILLSIDMHTSGMGLQGIHTFSASDVELLSPDSIGDKPSKPQQTQDECTLNLQECPPQTIHVPDLYSEFCSSLMTISA